MYGGAAVWRRHVCELGRAAVGVQRAEPDPSLQRDRRARGIDRGHGDVARRAAGEDHVGVRRSSTTRRSTSAAIAGSAACSSTSRRSRSAGAMPYFSRPATVGGARRQARVRARAGRAARRCRCPRSVAIHGDATRSRIAHRAADAVPRRSSSSRKAGVAVVELDVGRHADRGRGRQARRGVGDRHRLAVLRDHRRRRPLPPRRARDRDLRRDDLAGAARLGDAGGRRSATARRSSCIAPSRSSPAARQATSRSRPRSRRRCPAADRTFVRTPDASDARVTQLHTLARGISLALLRRDAPASKGDRHEEDVEGRVSDREEGRHRHVLDAPRQRAHEQGRVDQRLPRHAADERQDPAARVDRGRAARARSARASSSRTRAGRRWRLSPRARRNRCRSDLALERIQP